MSRGLRLTEEQLRRFVERGRAAQEAVDARPVPGADLAVGLVRKSRMNKTETAYAGELELAKRGGLVTWYAFEAIKLRLGERTFYTPDFLVRLASGALEVHEVKGFWRDDARVKIKVAAELFPFAFVGVSKIPRRKGGGWHFTRF